MTADATGVGAADADRIPTRPELEAELEHARQAMIDAERTYQNRIAATELAARDVADAIARYRVVRSRYFEDRRWAT